MKEDERLIYEKYKKICFNILIKESTSIIPVKGGHVLLSDYVKQHIQSHNEIGVGSVFKSDINLNNIESIIQDIDVSGDGGAYTVELPDVGYDLVLPISTARNLPDAQETQVEKDERGSKISVPAVTTSADLEDFKTNQLTIIIRPSNADYLPDDVKTQEILSAINQGQSYSVLTAFPGNPNIPPASQWNGKFAVILPNTDSTIEENWEPRVFDPDDPEIIARDEAFISQHFDKREDPSVRQVPAVIEYYKSGEGDWYNDISIFFTAADPIDPQKPLERSRYNPLPDEVNGLKIYSDEWKPEHFQAVMGAM